MPIATAGRSGSLDLGFARDPAGRTYLRRQHATHPFHVCRAQYLDRPRSGQATVYLQSCSGGLFRGDRHQVTIACDPGARAHVTTQASTVVHRADGDPARQAVALAVGAGAVLEYCPDPAILFPGAGLVNRTRVTLAPGAAALLWDACLGHDPGGAGAPFDRLDTDVQVLDDRGRLRAADRMAVTGAAFAAGTVGVMGPATCLGTVMLLSLDDDAGPALAAARDALPVADGLWAGASALPGACGVWCRIAAVDVLDLRRALDDLWRAWRHLRGGPAPGARRK